MCRRTSRTIRCPSGVGTCLRTEEDVFVTGRKAASLGCGMGLTVCAAILALMWWGVSGVLFVGNVDLASVFWPSFFLLTTTWHSSAYRVAITLSAIAINCLIYALLVCISRRGGIRSSRMVVRDCVRGGCTGRVRSAAMAPARVVPHQPVFGRRAHYVRWVTL